MNKNNGFREKMLILIVSYINESKSYDLNLENLEVIELNSGERVEINELIEDIVEDKSYIESLISKAFDYSIVDETLPNGHSHFTPRARV